MSATLKVKNSFEATLQGQTYTGCQGEAGTEPDTALEITLTGVGHIIPFVVSNNSNALLYEASNDLPATMLYLHFVADDDVWLQLITASGGVVVTVPANTPFVLPEGTILANASTTVLDGSVAPVPVAVTKVNVVNRSGGAVNGVLSVFL